MNKYIILLFNVLFLVSCSVKENKKTELIEDKVYAWEKDLYKKKK